MLSQHKNLNDNKKIWKKMKPIFSNKGLKSNNIMLKEKEELVTESSIITNIFIINLYILQGL